MVMVEYKRTNGTHVRVLVGEDYTALAIARVKQSDPELDTVIKASHENGEVWLVREWKPN